MTATDPHAGQRIVAAGLPLEEAKGAVILVHGRGGSPEDLLGLAAELEDQGLDAPLAWLAPQAAGYTWYPYSFMAPLEQNEPGLSSALALLGRLVEGIEDSELVVVPGAGHLVGVDQPEELNALLLEFLLS